MHWENTQKQLYHALNARIYGNDGTHIEVGNSGAGAVEVDVEVKNGEVDVDIEVKE